MSDVTHEETDEMTEDAISEAVEAPVSDAEGNEVESPTEAPVDAQEDDTKKGNSEAAKWRVRLRESEAKVATLEARVNDMHAAEVSRLATGPGKLHDGGDLLLTTQLADLLDDEGGIDPDKVTEAVSTLAEKKPHLAKPAFENGVGVGEKGSSSTASWASVISS